MRAEDLAYLKQWTEQRADLVEGYIEPETLVNEMSVVLVAVDGEFTRRPIGGPKGIDAVANALGIAVYDVEETGYPQRMRERIQRDQLLRRREEQRRRREEFERKQENAGD